MSKNAFSASYPLVEDNDFNPPVVNNVPDHSERFESPDGTAMAEVRSVATLEATGRYRILRKLVPRMIVDRPQSPWPRVGVIVDVETTGLSRAKDEVIELGMLAFTFGDDGHVGDVVGAFSALRQPTSLIPTEITRITGITDAMVEGRSISSETVEAFIAPADLIVAHNARFDRAYCDRAWPTFRDKAWACSQSEIRWNERGFEGAKLAYLVGQSGFFHEGHRAIDDCHALLEVLARKPSAVSESPFGELLQSSSMDRIRVWALQSPFDLKDVLKARGYRWSDGSDGQLRSWWVEVAESDLAAELHFLRAEIYRSDGAAPPVKRLSAFDRFKAT